MIGFGLAIVPPVVGAMADIMADTTDGCIYNGAMSQEIQRRKHYTELEVAQGLRQLALYGGNLQRTSDTLKAEGLEVSTATLKRWRNEDYPVQYEDIVYKLRQTIGSQVSDGAMEVAVDAMDASAQLVERVQQNLTEIAPKDAAKAALNLAQTGRTHVEVARLLRNEPNSIVEVRSVDESLDRLEELDVVDATVEEE